MKLMLYAFLISTLSLNSQTAIEATLQWSKPLKVSTFVDIDDLETMYSITQNEFSKHTTKRDLFYSNLQLGTITQANTFNSLRINLFYSNFNTVIILDNRLAEIFKIDFNTIAPYRNPLVVSTGYDSTLWLFNQNNQQLELYDYKTNTLRANSNPINSEVLDIVSNYNWCWLLTKEYLYQFNYVGSLVEKIKNEGFTKIEESNENLVLQKNNELFYLKAGTSNFIKINLADLIIKQFLLTNETLYIYDLKTLNQFHLKTL